MDSSLNAKEVKMETEYQENIFVHIQFWNVDLLIVGLVYSSTSKPAHINTKNDLITEASTKGFFHLFMEDSDFPDIDQNLLKTRTGIIASSLNVCDTTD